MTSVEDKLSGRWYQMISLEEDHYNFKSALFALYYLILSRQASWSQSLVQLSPNLFMFFLFFCLFWLMAKITDLLETFSQ